jgi:hypothetical protein
MKFMNNIGMETGMAFKTCNPVRFALTAVATVHIGMCTNSVS